MAEEEFSPTRAASNVFDFLGGLGRGLSGLSLLPVALIVLGGAIVAAAVISAAFTAEQSCARCSGR